MKKFSFPLSLIFFTPLVAVIGVLIIRGNSSKTDPAPNCVVTGNGTQVEDYYRDGIHYLVFTAHSGVSVVNYTTDSLERAFMSPHSFRTDSIPLSEQSDSETVKNQSP